MRACELKGLPGMEKPYEKVKGLMRGHEMSKEAVEAFIDQQSLRTTKPRHDSRL